MQIWIDADGCPGDVKDVIFKAAQNRQVLTIVVANRILKHPKSSYIRSMVVSQGLDVADQEIVKNAKEGDIVITADVPLAAEVVAKGCCALSPNGEIWTEENVSEKLSVRNFMSDLRGSGVMTGGSRPRSSVSTKKFAQAFDRILTKGLNQ